MINIQDNDHKSNYYRISARCITENNRSPRMYDTWRQFAVRALLKSSLRQNQRKSDQGDRSIHSDAVEARMKLIIPSEESR